MKLPEPTERLRFRAIEESDVDGFFEVFADPLARRFYPRRGDRADVLEFVHRQQRRYARDGHGLWALERREDGALVGDCGIVHQETELGRVLEVGYHVREAHRRKGYATEAARRCIDHAFERLAAPRVCSLVRFDNAPSQGVAARLHPRLRVYEADGVQLFLYHTERADWLAGR